MRSGGSPEAERDLDGSTPPEVILSGHVPDWDGEFVRVSPTVDITIALSDIQVLGNFSDHKLYILGQGFSIRK